MFSNKIHSLRIKKYPKTEPDIFAKVLHVMYVRSIALKFS